MEHYVISPRQQKVMSCLICMPQKILSLHGQNNVSEFVLHDLCKPECFNLKKAAYFVDNPDFDQFKGIAGFDYCDLNSCNDAWQAPDTFSEIMKKSSFNQKVRSINHSSVRRGSNEENKLIEEVAQQLRMENPRCRTWGLKHDNHGVFLYEECPEAQELADQLEKGLCLLGFCPIY